MIKRTISFILSLSLLTCSTTQIYAFDHVAIPQNIHLPTPPSSIQSHTSEKSFKSFEAKFKPKKEKAKLAETYSGTCGDNVNWNLDTSTGKLTISGSGAMTDYTSKNGAPWYSSYNSVKSITIGSSITHIGKYAFYDHNYLTSVSIGSGVKTIANFAFYCCDGCTSLTIPDSVVSIGAYAFENWSNLVALTIGSGVKSIDTQAFSYCESLTSVTYKGTSDPGASSSFVFYDTPVTSVNVPWNYKSIDFCGVDVSRPPAPTPTPKASRSPTPSRSPSHIPSRSPSPTPSPPYGITNWFIDNVAWMAPTFSIAVSAIGLLLKYNDIKNFCLSHCPCCHKKCETSEQQQLDINLL